MISVRGRALLCLPLGLSGEGTACKSSGGKDREVRQGSSSWRLSKDTVDEDGKVIRMRKVKVFKDGKSESV